MKKLSEDRIKRLNDIGFVWAPHEASWEENFDKLKKFKERFGHCDVPSNWSEDDQFARWVSWQRYAYRNETLEKERKTLLEEIGFYWESYDGSWEENFEKIQKYKERFGHCNVPKKWTEDKSLGNWVDRQRDKYKNRELVDEHIKRLEEIDFVWEPHDASWEENYEKIKKYKERFGHCNVPKKWTEDKSLGKWVSWQREAYKNKTLEKKRIKHLEEIGFVWDKLEAQWEEKFNALKEYKNDHGRCNVPYNWEKDGIKLGSWVKRQHQCYRKGKIAKERIKRLEDIGFEWEIPTE